MSRKRSAHEPLAAASGPAPEMQALQQQLAASQAQLEAAAAELAAVRAQLAASQVLSGTFTPGPLKAWVASRCGVTTDEGEVVRPCVLGVFDSPFLARLAVRKDFGRRLAGYADYGAGGLNWRTCLGEEKGGHWTLSLKAVKGLSPAAVAAIGVEVGEDADDALYDAADELQEATRDDIMEAFQRGQDVERFFNFGVSEANLVLNEVDAHWHTNGDGAMEWNERDMGHFRWSVAHCAINAPPLKEEPSWLHQFRKGTSSICRSCVEAARKEEKGKEEEWRKGGEE